MLAQTPQIKSTKYRLLLFELLVNESPKDVHTLQVIAMLLITLYDLLFLKVRPYGEIMLASSWKPYLCCSAYIRLEVAMYTTNK